MRSSEPPFAGDNADNSLSMAVGWSDLSRSNTESSIRKNYDNSYKITNNYVKKLNQNNKTRTIKNLDVMASLINS